MWRRVSCTGERGTARPEVLQSLLGTTQHVVQEIDSVEYGLTDIQEYYANTGALTNAATSAQVCVCVVWCVLCEARACDIGSGFGACDSL